METEEVPINIEIIAAEITILNRVLYKLMCQNFEKKLGQKLGVRNSTILWVLKILNQSPETLTGLSQKIMVSKASLIPIINMLEKKEIVAHTNDSKDKQERLITLTQLGHDVVDQIPLADKNGILVPRLEEMDKRELHNFLKFFRQIIATMTDKSHVERISKIAKNSKNEPRFEL